MKFKKIIIFLLSLSLGCTVVPAVHVRAAVHRADGTAGVSVTADAGNKDRDSSGELGTDTGDHGGRDDGGRKEPDDDKQDSDSGGREEHDLDDSGKKDQVLDSGGKKGQDSDDSRKGKRDLDSSGKEERDSDGGRKKDQVLDSSRKKQDSDSSRKEENLPQESRAEPGLALLLKAAVLALLAGAVLAFLLKRRKKRFHGILVRNGENGIMFRGNTDEALFVPALADKLNHGAVSFRDYKKIVLQSSAETIFPGDSVMIITIMDGGISETVFSGKADERIMLNRLGKAAEAARIENKMVTADVLIEHSRLGFRVCLHYVFR